MSGVCLPHLLCDKVGETFEGEEVVGLLCVSRLGCFN